MKIIEDTPNRLMIAVTEESPLGKSVDSGLTEILLMIILISFPFWGPYFLILSIFSFILLSPIWLIFRITFGHQRKIFTFDKSLGQLLIERQKFNKSRTRIATHSLRHLKEIRIQYHEYVGNTYGIINVECAIVLEFTNTEIEIIAEKESNLRMSRKVPVRIQTFLFE